MDAHNISDKRRDVRYEILDYAMVYDSAESEPVRCVIVDIGLGGLQLRSRDELAVGGTCLMNIGNLDTSPIRIRGEVRHSQKVKGSELFASGIRFIPETPEERTTVASYVHSVFQRQADLLFP